MISATFIREIQELLSLSEEDIARIKSIQKKEKVNFAWAAVLGNYMQESRYVDILSKKLELPAVDPTALEIPQGVIDKLPAPIRKKYKCVPFYIKDKSIFVAMGEPDNIFAFDDIRFCTGLTPVIHVSTPTQVQQVLDEIEQQVSEGSCVEDLLKGMEDAEDVDVVSDEEEEGDEISLMQEANQAPVVKMVNLIIMEAISKRASDIHIEMYEKEMRVRFRLDGVLKEIMKPPLKIKNALISRIKIMANLNIAEKRLPQDGRIKVKLQQGKEVEFRVSILPTLFGEKVVMRLLDKSALMLDMSKLGLEESTLQGVEECIKRPYGMFLVTGPTGSGKTTTLYSAILELNQEGVNIVTAEDPVEFSIMGINQVHIREEIGLTFASALRSFLRQDPDIILVGEIRDLETAEIAIKAALTGHLVLSTLHTNDAPSTIARMINMGVEKFLLASAINGIMAQRLVRKLCPMCKREAEKDEKLLKRLGMTEEEIATHTIYEPVGCSNCNHTGYKGRLGVYELLLNSPEIQELILKDATYQEIKEMAISQGMLTLRRSALVKLMAGLTSVKEVMRVTIDE